jgi:hypothetical protein
MGKRVYGILLICFALALSIKAEAQETAQKPGNDEKSKNAPAAFKYKLNYFIPKRPSPNLDPNLDSMLKKMNTIDLNILNLDPSRTIQELEYEIYTTDKESNVEVDHIRRVDRTKIKPGEEKKRRSLSWKPDSIAQNCNPPTKCTIRLRIVRIKFDDGSQWQGQLEAEKSEKASGK